ncbi:MAG: S41 family peptidase [Prevotellaceae bacterium]|jgi:carboxyl-terminal processing protease|nr:S41 family peptidase [Prevotellaceae bacterium]
MAIKGKHLASTLVAVALLGLGFVLGIRVQQKNIEKQFLSLQKWNKINAVLSYIDREYVDPIDTKKVEENAITDILQSLDPHSTYIPASNMKAVNEPLDGNFDGIGVVFNMATDTVVVINVIVGGPSERAGVLAGDRIVTVNDSVIAGRKIPQDSVMRLLRGPRKTKVTVGIHRVDEGSLVPITITRGEIPIKSVDVAYMLNDSVGYIKISTFSRNTYEEFMRAVEKLRTQNMTRLALDLRGNSGGYLDQSCSIANEFLKSGDLIVYTQGHGSPRKNYMADRHGALISTPVAVLIDEGSASASEVLSGAIQDNDRGSIVGRRSFGKGVVQEPIPFSDGSGMRLTVARYYTPTGRCIQRPYTSGSYEDYFFEIQRRYEHGEMDVADSIRQADTLCYTTPKGKVVYGGGGIMPDVFVPLDTTGVNKYLRMVTRRSLINKFALSFSDQHRAELRRLTTFDELTKYLDRRNLLQLFHTYATQNGVRGSADDRKASSSIILAQVKALIGRSTPLDDEGFYPFLDSIDNTLQKAVEVLQANNDAP